MKIIKVDWKDARTEGGLVNKGEADELKLIDVTCVGLLIKEHVDRIIVSSFYNHSENESEYEDGFRDVHVIPIANVTKITELKELV